MDLFEPKEITSFTIESNFMAGGRGYIFYANGDVSNILEKYQEASFQFKDDLDNVMKKWWDLLTNEERAVIRVDEKRTFRATSDSKTVREVIETGGFTQLTKKIYYKE